MLIHHIVLEGMQHDRACARLPGNLCDGDRGASHDGIRLGLVGFLTSRKDDQCLTDADSMRFGVCDFRAPALLRLRNERILMPDQQAHCGLHVSGG
jgi:hypothetical protein